MPTPEATPQGHLSLFRSSRCLSWSIAVGAWLLPIAAIGGVSRQTLSSGCGALSSTGYRVSATLGEPLSGTSSSDSGQVSAGFQDRPNQPPVGVLAAAQGAAGQPTPVQVQIFDESEVQGATLYYRSGGTTPFASLAMQKVDGAADTWQTTIPADSVSVRGIQYYIVASDGQLSSTIPPDAPQDSLASVRVRVTNLAALRLQAKRYELLGVPLAPDNPTIGSVFSALGAYDPNHWRYGTYADGGYLEPPAARPPATGQGFWLIASDATEIRLTGTSTPLDRGFPITLQPGWNQVANPYAFDVSVADISIPEGVEANFIGWTGTGYEPGALALEPAHGYWIKNDRSSAATITIPARPSTSRNRSTAAGTSIPFASSGPGWVVRVDGRAGEFRDEGNRFGLLPDATEAADRLDLSDAPPPPAGYLNLAFLPDGEEERLLDDFRPAASCGESWNLVVDSDQADLAYTIRFTVEKDLPRGWQCLILDRSNLGEIEIRTGAELRGVVPPGRSAISWRIVAGPPDFIDAVRRAVQDKLGGLRLRASVSPNPSAAKGAVVVTLTLPASTDLRLQVFDVGGRLVRRLAEGRYSRGRHFFTWEGRTDSGTSTGEGAYFIRAWTPQSSASARLIRLR